jgi:predicted 3-demethylubiquinone-9 3-methyltransferase (glyoxalase superfamily)
MTKVTPFRMFNDQLEAAMEFYSATFPDSEIRNVARTGKDPFGLSWQIVPQRFIELIRDKDARRVKAVMEAMMTMVKLDVAALERAYNEA